MRERELTPSRVGDYVDYPSKPNAKRGVSALQFFAEQPFFILVKQRIQSLENVPYFDPALCPKADDGRRDDWSTSKVMSGQPGMLD